MWPAMWRRPLLSTVLLVGLLGQNARAETQAATVEEQASRGATRREDELASIVAPGEHPGALAWGTTYVGVLWVNGYAALRAPILESSGVLRTGRWHVGFVLSHAPWSLHSHTRVDSSYRMWGAMAERAVSDVGASHATVSMSFDDVRYSETPVETTSMDVRLSSRFDWKLLDRRLRSVFAEGEVGYVGRRSTQLATDVVLDIRHPQFGIGVGYYLGDPTYRGSEMLVRYFRDYKSYCEQPATEPNQLRPPRGCVGFDLWHFLSPTWGLHAFTEVGTRGWVLGLHWVGRGWSDSANSNGLIDFGQ